MGVRQGEFFGGGGEFGGCAAECDLLTSALVVRCTGQATLVLPLAHSQGGCIWLQAFLWACDNGRQQLFEKSLINLEVSQLGMCTGAWVCELLGMRMGAWVHGCARSGRWASELLVKVKDTRLVKGMGGTEEMCT